MTNTNQTLQSHLDRYLAQEVREYIEKTYYARINRQAELDHLAHDKSFLNSMYNHIALYSDHGVIHVRDVARLMLETLDSCHGVHIAKRCEFRFRLMKGYGVMLAYLHDIGMINFSDLGRAVHSEFAAQEVFSLSFNKYIDIIWEENCSNLPWRILQLHQSGLIKTDPKTMLRECLALSPAHSKSKFAIEVLNDPARLRSRIIEILEYDLEYLYFKNKIKKLEDCLSTTKDSREKALIKKQLATDKKTYSSLSKNKFCKKTKRNLHRLYDDFQHEAFYWLTSQEPEIKNFIQDLTDTIRLLRCADSLRQRGTSFKTSGGYQIFTNLYTGNAIFALTNKKKQMFLLEDTTPHAIGEANISRTEFTPEGNLVISFYTGAFKTPAAQQNAANCIALIINDIILDVVDSLILPEDYPGKEDLLKKTPIKVYLENLPDNWEFTKIISTALLNIDPNLKSLIGYATQLNNVPKTEKERYINGQLLQWDLKKRKQLIEKVKLRGHKIKNINPNKCFNDVKLVTLQMGECLLEAYSPPGFVYLPLAKGLRGTPLGGYAPFIIQPYTFIGNSSVISSTQRNATIVADKKTPVIMIPQEIYIRYWHDTYNAKELRALLIKLYSNN